MDIETSVAATVEDRKARTRRHVLEMAAEILEREGVRAVSTRSVAAAAGVRAASLYQLFGDKDALLTALSRHAFDLYLAEKSALAKTDDPVVDMRRGWDAHVDFGLTHPAFYLLMYGPERAEHRPPAADQAAEQLHGFLDRAATAGRLRVAPPLAGELLLAAVTGATLTLISTPEQERDPEVSDRLRESVIASLTTAPAAPTSSPDGSDPGPTDPGLTSRALALDAALTHAQSDAHERDLPLRPTEIALLHDWLRQLAR